MEKNLKNIKAEFKSKGIFYTPPELAEMLKQYADFTPKKIYDPTCGQGNLLSVFPDDIEKYGQEIYQDEINKAGSRIKNFTGYCGDTLKDDGFKGVKFDLIVANPPFGIKWEPNNEDERFTQAGVVPSGGKADYAFLLHILWHLDDKGKAICLQFPGVLYRGQREGKIRKWFIDNNYIERVVHIPGNTFVDTTISTCLIILNKSKETTDIIFEDRELEEERTVKIEEVKSNGYTLSVSTYIWKEEVKEEINPLELQERARKGFLVTLEKELAFDSMVCKMEGWQIDPFIKDIEQIISRYKHNGN